MDIRVGIIAVNDKQLIIKRNRVDSGWQPQFQAQILSCALSEGTDPLVRAMEYLDLWTDIPPDSCHWTPLGSVFCYADNSLTIEVKLYLASIFNKPPSCCHDTSISWIPFSEAMKSCMDSKSLDFKDMASSSGLPRAHVKLLTDKLLYGD